MSLFPATARRRFVAAIAGAATALALMTAAAVPARAAPNSEDLAKALAAIAVLALIAKAGEDNDRGRARHRYDDDDYRYRPRQGGRFLPAACAVRVEHRGRGDRVVYGERCLRQSGVSGRLPYHCSIEARNRGRSITVFPQNCLFNAGFRPERGHGHW